MQVNMNNIQRVPSVPANYQSYSGTPSSTPTPSLSTEQQQPQPIHNTGINQPIPVQVIRSSCAAQIGQPIVVMNAPPPDAGILRNGTNQPPQIFSPLVPVSTIPGYPQFVQHGPPMVNVPSHPPPPLHLAMLQRFPPPTAMLPMQQKPLPDRIAGEQLHNQQETTASDSPDSGHVYFFLLYKIINKLFDKK